MRVKNEERYIAHAIQSILPLDGKIIVLDDGSTDGTPDILSSFDGLDYHRQDDLPMDEGRDRTFLYRKALELEPDWVFTLDGDEELDSATPERMHRAIERCPDEVNVFEMFLAVMYGGRSWRGPRSAWKMGRLFRVRDAVEDYEFTSGYGNNLHCGCVPEMRAFHRERLNAWIKYWGYENPEAVARKLEFYKEHDPEHYPAIVKREKRRARMKWVEWKDGLDAREIGIHGTVIY
jgi:glycosyltransferase involved in cell wall biosynthesis